jgi:hypothetical protein
MSASSQSLCLLLAVALAGHVSCLNAGHSGKSSSAMRLGGARLNMGAGGDSLVARASPKGSKKATKGGKATTAGGIADKMGEATAAVAQDISAAASKAAAVAQSFAGEVEGAVKEYPAQSSALAVAMLVLTLILKGGSAEEAPAADDGLLSSALARCMAAAASASDCAGKGIDSLSEAIWNSYQSCTSFAQPLVEKTQDSVVDASKRLAAATAESAGRFCNWLPNIASVVPLKYTLKSGSIKGGSFTIDLGASKIVGALVVTNKRCKVGGKETVNGGTRDFEVYVSQDGKVWDLAHKGWLLAGAPKCKSQYVTFTGKWGRYVKFVSKSSYKAGSGLDDLAVHPPTGLNSLLWATSPSHVLHSCFDSHMPDAWSQITVPDAIDVTSTILRAPVAITRMLGLDTPDDLGLLTVKSAALNATEAAKVAGGKAGERIKSATCKAANGLKRLGKGIAEKAGPIVGNVTSSVSSAASAASKAAKAAGKAAGKTAEEAFSKASKAGAEAAQTVNDVTSRLAKGKGKEVVEEHGSSLVLNAAILVAAALGVWFRDPIGESVGPAASNVASGISKTLESAIDNVNQAKKVSTGKSPAKQSSKKSKTDPSGERRFGKR